MSNYLKPMVMVQVNYKVVQNGTEVTNKVMEFENEVAAATAISEMVMAEYDNENAEGYFADYRSQRVNEGTKDENYRFSWLGDSDDVETIYNHKVYYIFENMDNYVEWTMSTYTARTLGEIWKNWKSLDEVSN